MAGHVLPCAVVHCVPDQGGHIRAGKVAGGQCFCAVILVLKDFAPLARSVKLEIVSIRAADAGAADSKG